MIDGSNEYDDPSSVCNLNALIPDEVLMEVLIWLPVGELLRSVAHVSRRFYDMLMLLRDEDDDDDDDGVTMLWKRKFLEIIQRSSSTGAYPSFLNQHQIQRCCWHYEHSYFYRETTRPDGISSSSCPPLPTFLQDGNLLVRRMSATRLLHGGYTTSASVRPLPIRRYVCLASSTDHPHERVENVLSDGGDRSSRRQALISEESFWTSIRSADRTTDETFLEGRQAALFSFSQPWWSSLPRSRRDAPSEILAFSMRHTVCLVSEVAIKPYTDWMAQTYTWKYVVVRVYNLPVITTTKEDNNGEEIAILKHLLPSTTIMNDRSNSENNSTNHEEYVIKTPLNYLTTDATPVYESQVMDAPPSKNNSWQYYELPFGVIGNVVTFELMGKNFRQFESSGYYVCVHRVEARGIPLYASPPEASMANNNEEQQETRRESAVRRDLEIVPLVIY